ncbi:MAG TPA: hypothetical protein VFR41_00025 [Acidimicrobiia bacterium]|nr:hypothetical protein [Acidimicrobiia bacterium]
MERKQALAVAAASSLVLGSALVALSAMGGFAVLGFGARPHGPGSFAITEVSRTRPAPRVVTKYKDVYDEPPAAGHSGAPASSQSATGGASAVSAPAAVSEPAEPPDTEEPTTAPAPPTTNAPTTPTTQEIEIPDDWPADKPLPPMPPNCIEPHLEDNGVWNCGGDD